MSQHDVMAEIRRLLPDGSFDPTLIGQGEPAGQRARRPLRRHSLNARAEHKSRRQAPIQDDMSTPGIGPWDLCPSWAPDVFAVAATLIELSGCYTDATRVGSNLVAHAAYLADVTAASDAWQTSNSVPQAVEDWWINVIKSGDTPIDKVCADSDLAGALFRLLAVADQVCVGIGWSSKDPRAATSAAKRALFSFLETEAGTDAPAPLPHHPHSLCDRVPPDVAIVLPKALTPAVGCTVRALSHHLALLPSSSIVSPRWYLTGDGDQGNEMRLLVVPFPFDVPSTSFIKTGEAQELGYRAKTQGYFGLKQTWLQKPDGTDLTAEEFVDALVVPLLDAARRESDSPVHGILLPECAVSSEFGMRLADVLATRAEQYGLRFLISGLLDETMPGHTRNLAMGYVFDRPRATKVVNPGAPAIAEGAHSKHHRWCLDRAQVKRYGLSGLFHDGTERWWEEIDVSARQLPFFAIRDDLCMTVLICEDLARADPAMPVLRAVGPNLVVALLMDGPQLDSRWPARYATVLADDPGSSVLTITCAGMVDRSNYMQANPRRSVGLWRHANGHMQELFLPKQHYGLLLTLRSVEEEQFSLDHRSDGSLTSRLELEWFKPLPLPTVPAWVEGLS